MRELKQSTAANVMVFMTDSADHIAGKTGLTLTITASKNGAAFASITPTVTERGDGWYSLSLTSSHTDTLGDLAIHITSTGADPTDLASRIIAMDKTVAATPANVTQFGGSAGTFASGRPEVNTTHAAGTAWGSGAITAASIAAGAIDAATFAADVDAEARGWLGLASANLDTQLADVPTVSEFNARTLVAADYLVVADLAGIAQESTLTTIAGYIDTEIGTILTNLADVPTVAEFEARTLLAADYTVVSDLGTVQTGDTYALANGANGFAATKADTAAVKVVTDKLDDTVEDDAGTFRFSTNALEQAPTGGSAPTAAAIADEVRVELGTELARIDAAISTRLAAGSYTAPDNATIGTAAASAATAATQAGEANTKAGAIQTILAGITSLAQWLGLIAGKQTGNTTARTELRATGAGSGTFDETTDSVQAIRDRGDAAWTGGGGGGSSTVVIGPVAATVTDVAIAASTGGVIHPLSMFKAQRATVVFQIVDGEGDFVDITGDDLSFVIHDTAGTTIAEINTTNEAAQFVVGDSGVTGATGDQLTLTIEPTQNNQTPGAYEYKLWNTTLDVVLATGKYQIKTAPQS